MENFLPSVCTSHRDPLQDRRYLIYCSEFEILILFYSECFLEMQPDVV